jgi:hypothetical protein
LDSSQDKTQLLADGRLLRPLPPTDGLIPIRLGDLAEGPHRIGVSGCPHAIGFLKRPPEEATAQGVYRVRTYYRLPVREPFTVVVEKKSERDLFLNFALYLDSALIDVKKSFRIEASIGQNKFPSSFAVRPAPPPYERRIFRVDALGGKTGYCLQKERCKPSFGRSFFIPLNAWYGAGEHAARLMLLDDAPVLARFFSYQPQDENQPVKTYYRE